MQFCNLEIKSYIPFIGGSLFNKLLTWLKIFKNIQLLIKIIQINVIILNHL